MKVRIGPQQNRASMCTMSEGDSKRIRKLIIRTGSIEKTRLRLGIGDSTMESARACGRMQMSTRDKVLEALAREEAIAP